MLAINYWKGGSDFEEGGIFPLDYKLKRRNKRERERIVCKRGNNQKDLCRRERMSNRG